MNRDILVIGRNNTDDITVTCQQCKVVIVAYCDDTEDETKQAIADGDYDTHQCVSGNRPCQQNSYATNNCKRRPGTTLVNNPVLRRQRWLCDDCTKVYLTLSDWSLA